MQALQCKVCGGSLIMDDTYDFAKCEYCGMKYTPDSVQQMIHALDHVELRVQGVANLDTQISRAETYLSLGEKKKAIEVLNEVTNLYPQDYRGWWLLAQTLYIVDKQIAFCDHLSSSKEFKYALTLAPEFERDNLLRTQVSYSQHVQEVQRTSELYFQEICSRQYSVLEEKVWISGFYWEAYFSVDGELYIVFRDAHYNTHDAYDCTCDKIAIERVFQGVLLMKCSTYEINDRGYRSRADHSIFKITPEQMIITEKFVHAPKIYNYGNMPTFSYGDDPRHVSVLTPVSIASADPRIVTKLNEEKQKIQQSLDKYKRDNAQYAMICSWKKSNKCQYCGGDFSFFGYCKLCKKERNY